jgi:outer membrane protein
MGGWRIAAAVIGVAVGGCAPILDGAGATPGTSSSPSAPWAPPKGLTLQPAKAPVNAPPVLPRGITLDAIRGGQVQLGLAEVVQVALDNNLSARDAWLQAQVAANALGVARSEYYPTLELDTLAERRKESFAAGKIDFRQTTITPTLNLSWTVLDLGGRSARVDEARQTLIAADWTHDATLQNVVLQVEQAYFQFLNAKALLTAEQSTIASAKASLEAAQTRQAAGVGTLADVLQAKTALSQAELNLATIEGQIETIAGGLATAMGLPANLALGVGLLPENVPVRDITEAVDSYIAEAVEKRPELAAARARAEGARRRIGDVRSAGLPSLAFAGSYNRTFYLEPSSGHADNYSLGLTLRVPLFSGFSTVYGIRQAEKNAEDAQVQVENLEQQIILQVWTSYFAVKTSAKQLVAARDLLASAQENQDVALGRFRAGVGNILDLLTAQSTLANARAQEVQSRSVWFLSLAQLAHDTGVLDRPSKNQETLVAPPKGQP